MAYRTLPEQANWHLCQKSIRASQYRKHEQQTQLCYSSSHVY
jgi:hypothetical protein